MASVQKIFRAPIKDRLVDQNGYLSKSWEWYFDELQKFVWPLGNEQSFAITNNQGSAADVTGMKFNSGGQTSILIEYLVQRITTGAGAQELTESGILLANYNPTSNTWNLAALHEHQPDDAGMAFTITSAGQVQYTSSNITGTASISTIWWRSRTLGGKNSNYSSIAYR